ncbi:MAG: MG2 domain-containing protein [Deltaproteobacteria bacterium]|jgi:uncharacterized protein YfaS (alpha-2-macroglobulin family)
MKRSILFTLLALLTANEAVAKPLYITVPRAYGTDEPVVVDIAFQTRNPPVELRVLRPKNVEKFVQAQANLRRAYEAPSLQINTGRYLSRGLNALRSPGGDLLSTIDPELRRALAVDMPERAPVSRTGARLDSGPKHLVDIPSNTELVDRRWLNLELGGAELEFSVPGFEGWGSRGGFQQRKVTLGQMKPGLYVLQLVQGHIEGQVLVVVSDLSVQVKQTDGSVLVRVAGRDQKPRPGAEVSLFSAAGAGPTGTTNQRGEVTLETTEPKLVALAKVGDDLAVVDTDFYSTLAISPDVFIYTDRPIYKPGHTASFRGILRQPDSFLSRLFAPRNRRVKVTVSSQDGASASTTAVVDAYGTFEGTIKAPGKDTGVLTFVASVDDRPYQAEARIQDYVKPTFYLEVRSDRETVRPGETIRATIRARRYAGGAPKNTKYDFTLSRTILDTPAWVDDAGLGAEGSAVTYGSVSTTEGSLSIPERIYSSADARGASYDSWSTAPTFDANGEATIEIPVPALAPDEAGQPFRYVLAVKALDDQDSSASKSRPFFFSPTEVLGTLRSNTTVIITGGDAQVAVRSTTPSGKVYASASGRVTFVLEKADGAREEVGKATFTTDLDGVWRGKYPKSGVGRLLAEVELDDADAHTWKGSTSILVAGRDGEPIVQVPVLTTESLGGTMELGDTAEVVALLPNDWGPGGNNRGFVWLTLQGTKIFESKMVEFEGRTLVYAFPIEARFGSAVYASVAYPSRSGRWEERIVPFTIVPKERALRVTIEAMKREAQPLSQQSVEIVVTDHEGRGVESSVSVGVVDKAIYALQREFRPNVLEFFYPIVRNNVTSFYSLDFAGYGYGERIAMLNGFASHTFASIKPPTMEEKEDTAYWNPSVRTGPDGRATVRFRLPGNQTLWTITAVAADDSGRFGESTSEFATRGRVSVVTSVPQFLREGDVATGSVRVAKGDKAKVGSLDVVWSTQGAAKAEQGTPKISLADTTEVVTPIPLASTGLGVVRVETKVRGDELDVSDRKQVPVRRSTVTRTESAERFGGGDLLLSPDEGATVEAVELELLPTSVAVALANLRSLLAYPYGCLEQRVATTIPNVAVYQTLETADAMSTLDPATRALLSEARSRAVRGVAQILDLALPTGGFTWFNGYDTPSVELTLIALDGLAYARTAGLVRTAEPGVTKSLRWLESQTVESPELAAMQTYVLARWGGKRYAPRVRQQLEAGPSGSHHVDALTVLAAHATGVDKEAKDAVAALATKSLEALTTLESERFDGAAYWRFPMRDVGLGALLGHAAFVGGAAPETIRERMRGAVARSLGAATFDRSTFLLHSQWLLKMEAGAAKSKLPKVTVDNGEVAAAVSRGLGSVHGLDAAARRVVIGDFDGVARLTAKVSVPGASAKATSNGMSITKKYFAIGPDGSRTPISSGGEVTVGDEVYVELSFDAQGDESLRGRRSAYYVVTDDVPAGFVVLQEDKAYRGAPYALPLDHESLRRRTFSPERATWFFDEPTWWSRSTRTIGYVMRAQFAGTFVAPPAAIEDMYGPAIQGRSAGASLQVKPRGE